MKFLRSLLFAVLALASVPAARADYATLLVDTNGVIQFTGFWSANSNALNAVVTGGGAGTNGITVSQINTISNLLQAGYISTNTATLGVLTNYVTGQLGSYITTATAASTYQTQSSFASATNALATLTTNYYVAKANFGLGANYVTFTNGFNVIPIVLGGTPIFLYLGGTTNDPTIQFSTTAP